MHLTSAIVFFYAALVGLGGFAGYARAKSLPSLIGGEVGLVALIIAGYGLSRGQAWGLPLALVLILGLGVFFAARYARTRAVMPGGVMTVLSLLALAGVLLTRTR